MPLSRKDTDFAYAPIVLMTPRQVPLERTLGNLVLYLHTGGKALSSAYKTIKLVELMEHLRREFDLPETSIPVMRRWLLDEFLELDPKTPSLREAAVSGAYPLHATAIKLQKGRAYKDYRTGAFIYSVLLQHDQVRRDLKDFFWQGMEDRRERDKLDLQTLFLVQALDDAPMRTFKTVFDEPELSAPYCRAHSALLANDLRRLLLYKDVMPRREVIRYLLALQGFHLSLYYLRLFRAIPKLLQTGKSCDGSCRLEGPEPACTFHFRFFLDASDEYKSRGAELASAEVQRVYALMGPYVKAHLTIKKLAEFGEEWARLGRLGRPNPERLAEIVALRQHPDLQQWADHRTLNVLEDDEVLESRLAGMGAVTRNPFDRYIELIFPEVFKRQGKHLREALDAFAGKNKPYGFMRAGSGRRRRFVMSSGLLELLVQLAMVDYDEDTGRIYQRNLTVTELLDWLDQRYGLLIDDTSAGDAGFEVERAARENLAHFKAKLHELGFFVGLSDASNVQYVRPRFELEGTVA
jgi:hypothetical protein